MFSNKRKTIGIIAETISDEFSARFCRGAIEEAKRRDYNTAIFSCHGKYGWNQEHYEGDRHIFELPPYEEFDGMILLPDTILDISTKQHVRNYVQNRCQCPVVSVREQLDNANNLLIDNHISMESIVKHFVEDHHFTNLCFMAGPQNRWDSVERLGCFLRIMNEHEIAVNKHQIFYGDFWKNKGKEACDWFLYKDNVPDAIICANDYMATSVASELLKRGYSIPQDICVSGYDGLVDTLYFSPSITTVGIPFQEMGTQAVKIIDRKQKNPSDCENYYFDVQTIIGESCGCLQPHDQEMALTRCERYEKILAEQNLERWFDFFSIHLSDCKSMQHMAEKVADYVDAREKTYCICLNKDFENEKVRSDYSSEMELRISIINDGSPSNRQIPFDKKELLPAEVTSDSCQAWFFSPLHFDEKIFGYEATQFKRAELTANVYLGWNIIMNRALQDILLHQMIEHSPVVEEDIQPEQVPEQTSEHTYSRDDLTGMYTRQDLEQWAGPILTEAAQEQFSVFLAVLEIDDMQQIHDHYGEAECDFVRMKLKDAIWDTCGDTETNARTGDNEFVIFAYGTETDKEIGLQHLEAVEAYLDRFNSIEEKPYEIHVSTGYIYDIPLGDDTIEGFIEEGRSQLC